MSKYPPLDNLKSASRPDAPPPAEGHPGADATLPAGLAPVEDASRRGDGQELGQSLGADADDRLTRSSPALGNRGSPQSDHIGEVNKMVEADMLGGAPAAPPRRGFSSPGFEQGHPSEHDIAHHGAALPADNLTVPLHARPTPLDLAYFARQLLALIDEAPPTPQRLALIKKQNERGIALLKTGAVEQYDEVQAALARSPA